MKPSWSSALGAYAGVMTLGVLYFVLGGAASPSPKVLDLERINIREPDGTLRLAIASHARMPGYIVDGREIPHPNRPEAGMIFFNDEGTENGGLVFDGRLKDGRPTNGGSLTFDRWHQDQTVQLLSEEDGPRRTAGVTVIDRPDRPLDLTRAAKIAAMPRGPARDAAIDRAGYTAHQRAFLGRGESGDAALTLRDAAGHPRLALRVSPAGEASIQFLDQAGRPTRTLGANAPR